MEEKLLTAFCSGTGGGGYGVTVGVDTKANTSKLIEF